MESITSKGGVLFLQNSIHELTTSVDENASDNDFAYCSKNLHKSKFFVLSDVENLDFNLERSRIEKVTLGMCKIFSDFRDYLSVPSYIHQAYVERICSSFAWKSKIVKCCDNSNLLVVLTTNWLRVVDVTKKVDDTFATELMEKSDHGLSSLLIGDCIPRSSQRPTSENEAADKFAANARDYRFCLGHSDAFPKWRAMTTFGRDLDSLIVAIAFSDGFIELIWVSEAEINAKNLTGRIHIDTFSHSSRITKPINSLTPVTDLCFIDISHLLISNFSGYVDLWFVDKASKSTPVRLLKRFVTGYAITSSLYHPDSACLVIGSEGQFSQQSSLQYGLRILRIGTVSPYIIHFQQHGIQKNKTTRKPWINHLFRRNPKLGSITESDCVLKMLYTTISDDEQDSPPSHESRLVLLHCSGMISVWNFPPKEPLLLFPVSGVAFPTNISLWSKNPEPGSSLPLFVIIKESGELSIFDLEKQKERHFDFTHSSKLNHSSSDHLQFNPLASLVVSEEFDGVFVLNWDRSPEASSTNDSKQIVPNTSIFTKSLYYFYALANRSLELVGIDAGPFLQPYTPASVARELEACSKAYHEPKLVNYMATVIRVCPTTPNGLLSQQLKMGDYSLAMSLAEKHGLNEELVYKHHWLSFFSPETPISKPDEVIPAIDCILGKLSSNPCSIVWSIRECMERFPSVNSDWKAVDVLDFCSRLLNHGISLLNETQFEKDSEQMKKLIKSKFEVMADHVETVRLMLKQDLSLSAEETLKILQWMRADSVLSLATFFAHNSEFPYLRLLASRYPREVKFNILVILPSLLETTPSECYLETVLFPIILEQPDEKRLEISTSEAYASKLKQMFNYLSPKYRYFQEMEQITAIDLIEWTIFRAKEIENMTLLTKQSLSLVKSVLNFLCEEFQDHNEDTSASLARLRHLHSDYEQLISLLYENHSSYSISRLYATKFNICESDDSLSGSHVMLDRLTADKFDALTPEQKIELAITLKFDPKLVNRFRTTKGARTTGQDAQNPIISSTLHTFCKQILSFIEKHSEEQVRSRMLACSLLKMTSLCGLEFLIGLCDKIKNNVSFPLLTSNLLSQKFTIS
ncbi:hypothetical protein Ciccas_010060 [Cichlidogyrus casuarinus]|uniref:Uncharacterized protein n=1 Tax=Cichlidogyrus casuarinus TaxID=1844966 RepID=A0ABD2PV66_9PLAT